LQCGEAFFEECEPKPTRGFRKSTQYVLHNHMTNDELVHAMRAYKAIRSRRLHTHHQTSWSPFHAHSPKINALAAMPVGVVETFVLFVA
jgi:hypothetical protein